MKQISAKFFECTCKYDKTQEDGYIKKVSETNVVDALSFAEAETRFVEEMSSYISGEFDVMAIKIAPYKEVFFSDKETDDRWYKVKVALISYDEKTNKEKRSNIYYLVQGASIDGAIKNTNEAFGSSMMDYVSIAVSETKIFDVFLHSDNKEETED